MMAQITMTSRSSKLVGEITRFDVTARCPHCENDTSVSQDEARRLHVQCQHCDEEFQIYLAD
jgi:transcription elongation factor Elf1